MDVLVGLIPLNKENTRLFINQYKHIKELNENVNLTFLLTSLHKYNA